MPDTLEIEFRDQGSDMIMTLQTGTELTRPDTKCRRSSFLRCNGGSSSSKMIPANIARLMSFASGSAAQTFARQQSSECALNRSAAGEE